MSPKISNELSKHRLERAKLGHRIAEASKAREDSDYDDEFIVNSEETKQQIETAKELICLVEKYINEKIN